MTHFFQWLSYWEPAILSSFRIHTGLFSNLSHSTKYFVHIQLWIHKSTQGGSQLGYPEMIPGPLIFCLLWKWVVISGCELFMAGLADCLSVCVCTYTVCVFILKPECTYYLLIMHALSQDPGEFCWPENGARCISATKQWVITSLSATPSS